MQTQVTKGYGQNNSLVEFTKLIKPNLAIESRFDDKQKLY